MITPFLAFWYYPAYSGVLNALRASPATDWLTAFFLPHFSDTTDPALNALTAAGWWLVGGGLLVFALTAAQVYWAKFARGGVVRAGLYGLIRHPQYTALIATGIGVMLIWPRFVVLLALVSMAFLYLILARHEERQCLARFGDDYAAYMARTGAFFPRLWTTSAPTSVPSRPIVTLLAYLIALTAAGTLAYGMREHSMAHVAALYEQREAILSPALLSKDELRAAHTLAAQDPRVVERIAGTRAGRVSYVVPRDWYMPDLPIDPLHEIAAGGHGAPKAFDRTKFQVLFAEARTFRPAAQGKSILRTAHGIRPLALADVDLVTGTVTKVSQPPPHVVWGDIPMPLF
jgi:protein-S-isoprenylcysteine O-methyltransferase Ste14